MVVSVAHTFADGTELADVRAAIQAAWLANEDGTAIEIAKRYDLHGKLCMMCASWESRWTLCVSCARFEIKQLGDRRFPADSVRAFQQQWTAEHPKDPLIDDGIVGIATMVRGWRPYRTYGIA